MTRRATRAFRSRRRPRTLCRRLCCVVVDARDARACVSTHISAVRRRAVTVAVLHLRPFAAFRRCFAVAVLLSLLLLLCAKRSFARAWRRCGGVVTCASVAVSLACVVE
jgi:hypothetical protein